MRNVPPWDYTYIQTLRRANGNAIADPTPCKRVGLPQNIQRFAMAPAGLVGSLLNPWSDTGDDSAPLGGRDANTQGTIHTPALTQSYTLPRRGDAPERFLPATQ